MAEVTYSSPGVYTNEIDLTGPTTSVPTGVPAGIIGTANEGPAFVPLTIGSYSDFVRVFGATDGEKFGPLAVHQFLKNATSLTYIRVLGIGDGKQRDSSTGKVTNAGFVVGAKQVQANGYVGVNPYALDGGVPGRTYFLGCYMSASAGSTIFSDAGIQRGPPTAATITITATGAPATSTTLTLTNTTGDSLVFTSTPGDGSSGTDGTADPPTFDRNSESYALAGLKTSIEESSLASSFTVGAVDTDGGYFLTITQAVEGVASNTAVTSDCDGWNIDSAGDATSTRFSGGSDGSSSAQPILRGVVLAPSGVILRLSGTIDTLGGSGAPSSTAPARMSNDARGLQSLVGALTGAVDTATQRFTMLLNGHVNTGAAPNIITASFDLEDASYFSNILNTDPAKIEEKGHLLYSHYDIHPSQAVVTGSGILGATGWQQAGTNIEPIGFLTTGSATRDSGTASVPNYESFEDRFTHPKSPFVISQTFGGKKYDIVRVHAIGDGAYSNTHIKISVENIKPSTSDTYKYGTFDLIVRQFDDTDLEKRVLEAFRGLNTDPSSDKFVARAVGDRYSYFDFDQASSSQKLVVAGDHPVKSNYIRVEQSQALKNGEVPKDALPFGFRGIDHLVTSGSLPMTDISGGTDSDIFSSGISDVLKRIIQPPLPLRTSVAVGTSPNKRQDSTWYWGAKFMQTTSVSKPNTISLVNNTVAQLTKFFPNYGGTNRDFMVGNNPGAADSGGTVLDCDRFNNNVFTLERLTVRTGSDENADPNEWVSASYTRNGDITANAANKTRAFKASDLSVQGNRTFGKYTFFLQAGFDGLNIFNKDASKLLNAAARREMDDSTAQGGTAGPVVSAYRKALDIMGTKSDVDIKLLAIPGLRHTSVTNYAIDTVENRFDAMYVMDIEERDEMNSVITSSVGSFANVALTVESFKGRALDTSFAAAYFPDVIMTDPTTKTNAQCPPSVAVMGAMALNDTVGYPWFAPAGFTRGALSDVLFGDIPLNKSNLDDLYDADINPITSFPNTGVMVFGQKTLLAAASALDRVNVRRLLIDIRRKVRNVANLMLFEPNRQETLDKFSALVQPILQSIQEKSGVDRFKVVIDATTTTQADVENNTLRGKIFLQPTRTAEFVALDFVLTNAGDAFENA